MSNVKNYRIDSTTGETVTAMPTAADFVYVNNTNAVLSGTNQTVNSNHFTFDNSTITVNGSNNSLIEKMETTSNSVVGNNLNSSTTVNILGHGNTYTINALSASFILGNRYESTEDINKIYVSSSSESAKNTFN